MHNKFCLLGRMPIPAHEGSDAPLHTSYVCLPPVHLTHVVSLLASMSILLVHVYLSHVSYLSLFCGFRACCQSHTKLHGIPTHHESWASTNWLYQPVCLCLLKFLRNVQRILWLQMLSFSKGCSKLDGCHQLPTWGRHPNYLHACVTTQMFLITGPSLVMGFPCH